MGRISPLKFFKISFGLEYSVNGILNLIEIMSQTVILEIIFSILFFNIKKKMQKNEMDPFELSRFELNEHSCVKQRFIDCLVNQAARVRKSFMKQY